MKKIISLIMALSITALLMASCSAPLPDANKTQEGAAELSGKWALALEEIWGMKMTPGQAQMTGSLEIKADGTAELQMSSAKSDCTWTKDGSKVTIQEKDGDKMEGTYEDNTLILTAEDEDVGNVTFYFGKDGTGAVNPEYHIKDGDITYDMITSGDPESLKKVFEKMSPEAIDALGLTEAAEMIKGLTE